MFNSKDVTLIATFAALLIGVQFALSFAPGVELVSVALFSFCAVFGVKRGVTAAVVFAVLRCIVFGAIPTVIMLYLIYFPLYALVSSLCGKLTCKWKLPVCVLAAAAMTACFTLLDDVIWPLINGLSPAGWYAYFIASLPVMLTQVICVAVTVLALFPVLEKLFSKLRAQYFL